MMRKTWSAFGVGGAAVLAAGIALYSGTETQIQAQAPAVEHVRAIDSVIVLKHEAILASDRPGILEFVEFEEGDEVAANAEVARLKDEIARAALKIDQEKATNDVHIRYAVNASQFADKELEISVSANSRLPGTVPQNEIEKLALAAKKGLLQIEQAQHEQLLAKMTVEQSDETLKTYKVVAPFSGIVSKVHLTKGEAVRQGDPIIEIISTATVNIEGYISIEDSYKVKAGDKVIVNLNIHDVELDVERIKLEGVVKFIDPRFSPLIGSVKLTAEVSNPDNILKPGLNADMVIIPSARQAARR
jgi:multidrug efflux pump subunit AcrA (membrane-fusion protein)